jgi:hypothetical protein
VTARRIRGRVSSTVILCAAAALALGVAGCGDDTPAATEDTPQPSFEEDGTVPVDDFNAYLDAVDEAWETDAKRVAIAFAQPVAPEGGQVGAALGAGDAGTTLAIVTVNGLGDDSAAARRTSVVLAPDGDRWRLVRAQWTHRCQEGRGHEDWSIELCI